MQRAALTTRPAAVTTRPAGDLPTDPATAGIEALQKPYRINPKNIVMLVYHLCPQVRAKREEMEAARHALTEFRTNLSRLEPFISVQADSSKFPHRRHVRGLQGETVGGIEKETFEGAVLRLEGGASMSRFEYGDVEEDQDRVDEGSGGLVRARLEVPFVGSRKRQSRVISQAFQETQAREAVLGYLQAFQRYVQQALIYYYTALQYLDYAEAYDRSIDELQAMLKRPGVRAEDTRVIQSRISSAEVLRDQYDSTYRSYLLTLLSMLGIDAGEEIRLEKPSYQPSRWGRKAATEEGIQEMIQQAFANNPTFRVLQNAIRTAQVQREQAILGEYDVTAFVEGTQFPFGAETYDDRVEGWQVGGGLTVRLNDQRVLTASRLKAEASIRRFQAEIESERLRIQKEVLTETDTLRAREAIQEQVLQLIDQTWADYQDRLQRFFEQRDPALTIDDVLYALTSWRSALVRLAATRGEIGHSEAELLAVTGEVYRMVGMRVDEEHVSLSDSHR